MIRSDHAKTKRRDRPHYFSPALCRYSPALSDDRNFIGGWVSPPTGAAPQRGRPTASKARKSQNMNSMQSSTARKHTNKQTNKKTITTYDELVKYNSSGKVYSKLRFPVTLCMAAQCAWYVSPELGETRLPCSECQLKQRLVSCPA